jgi:hypothetical protein
MWGKTDEISVPATKFTLFPELAAELRAKIWYWAAQHPRLIEIEYVPASDPSNTPGSHPEHRVCPKSRRPPTLLHINRESREEAMKVYRLRTFDSDQRNSSQRYIYFNPDADIVYFGEKNCFATMIRVFMQATRDGEEIPRVAIEIMKRCSAYTCPHDQLMRSYFGLVDEMKILHGFAPKVGVDSAQQWNGCPGLREGFLVVKSRLWDVKAGDVDVSVGLRPASTNGIAEDQISRKEALEADIRCLEWGLGLYGVGECKWLMEAPKFHFVSFAPVNFGAPDNRIHSSMLVEQEGIRRLEQNNWSFIKRLESRTGCHITIPKNPSPRRRPLELGFFGTKAGIEKAKQAICEKAMTYADIQKWRSETMSEPIKREPETWDTMLQELLEE